MEVETFLPGYIVFYLLLSMKQTHAQLKVKISNLPDEETEPYRSVMIDRYNPDGEFDFDCKSSQYVQESVLFYHYLDHIEHCEIEMTGNDIHPYCGYQSTCRIKSGDFMKNWVSQYCDIRCYLLQDEKCSTMHFSFAFNCKNYKEEHCGKNSRYCSYHGTCYMSWFSTAISCECDEGFSGPRCQHTEDLEEKQKFPSRFKRDEESKWEIQAKEVLKEYEDAKSDNAVMDYINKNFDPKYRNAALFFGCLGCAVFFFTIVFVCLKVIEKIYDCIYGQA